MKNCSIFLFVFLSFTAFSTKVLPSCDILFFQKDTLFLNKIFVDKILNKIKKQTKFKINQNPREENQYKAYWELTDGKLYLLKVTNRTSDSWGELGITDTLDLKKSFGNKYNNGKVAFNMKNLTIYLHKRYKLRLEWNWYPTYLEDYTFHFKNNLLFELDTVRNYFDNPKHLNRYSHFQFEFQLYQIMIRTMKLKSLKDEVRTLRFKTEISISNDGSFESIDFSNYQLMDVDSTIIPINFVSFSEFFDKDEIEKVLISSKWDMIKRTNNDKAIFEFEYDAETKKFLSPRFIENLDRKIQRDIESLPWYILEKYNESLNY